MFILSNKHYTISSKLLVLNTQNSNNWLTVRQIDKTQDPGSASQTVIIRYEDNAQNGNNRLIVGQIDKTQDTANVSQIVITRYEDNVIHPRLEQARKSILQWKKTTHNHFFDELCGKVDFVGLLHRRFVKKCPDS